MKKKLMAVCLICIMAMSLTGCSWSDIKAKFTGGQPKDYVASESVSLGEYKGIEVDCSVSEEEVESALKSLQTEKETTNKIKNRKAKMGDSANIDYVGKVDGKEFDGGSSEGYSLSLGSKTFIEGFEEGVVGMKPGETKDLNLKFPDDYHEDLKGKDVVFTVTLNYIEETITPEVNDEFIAKNTSYKTVDEFKKEKEKELIKEREANAGESAMNSLLDTVKVVKYPDSLVNKYKSEITKQFEGMLKSNGMTVEAYKKSAELDDAGYKAQILDAAKEQTKVHLIVEAISDKEKLSVSEDEVKKQIETIASSNPQAKDVDTLRKQFKESYGLELEPYVEQMLLQQKVQDLLGKNAKLTNNEVK